MFISNLSLFCSSHWSLVIICMPDKEDKLGVILLHLDSLKLHSNKLLFRNIKRSVELYSLFIDYCVMWHGNPFFTVLYALVS